MIIDQYNAPDNVGSLEIRPLGPCGQAKAGAGSSDPTQPQAAMATPQPLYTQGRGNEHLRGAIFGGKYISFLFFNWLPTSIRVDPFIGLFVRMRTKSLFLVESGENMIYSKYIFHHPFHWKNIYYILYNIFLYYKICLETSI